MKRALVFVIVIAAFVAGYTYAQATVSLYPDVQVSSEQRANAVWAVCYLRGYEGDWEDGPAMWAYYREQLIEASKLWFRLAKDKEAKAALPAPESYDLGVE